MVSLRPPGGLKGQKSERKQTLPETTNPLFKKAKV